jgi:hypothetical protein
VNERASRIEAVAFAAHIKNSHAWIHSASIGAAASATSPHGDHAGEDRLEPGVRHGAWNVSRSWFDDDSLHAGGVFVWLKFPRDPNRELLRISIAAGVAGAVVARRTNFVS